LLISDSHDSGLVTRKTLSYTLQQAVGGRPERYASAPASWQHLCIYSPGGTCSGMLAIQDISNKLAYGLLTWKVVSKSHVTCATSVPILCFLRLSVLKLRTMFVTDVRQKHRLMPPPTGRHNNKTCKTSDKT